MKLRGAIAEELAEAERMFGDETGGLDAPTQWHRSTDAPTQALLQYASGADIIVCGGGVEPPPAETRVGPADLIMTSGLPVLTIPSGAELDVRTIVVGWKDRREARRAVWDALPFLIEADRVLMLHFNEGGEESGRSLMDAAERLGRHGVAVEAETRAISDGPAGDIVAAAQAVGAGLVVVGGYGNSRLREWALGGVTQSLLAHAPVCTLYSH